MIVLNIVLIIPMICLGEHKTIYDILFALVTGITASFGVSVCIECSNNYRYNTRKTLELSEYYSVFWSYEMDKGIGMCKPEFFIMDHTEEELWEPLDDIQVMWRELPKLMPIFQKTVEERREFLSYKELEALNAILWIFAQMKRYIHMILLPEVSEETVIEAALKEDIPVGRKFLEKVEEEDSGSYMLSMLLGSILENIEVLEKEALKQPVAGFLLKDMKQKHKRNVFNMRIF